MKRMVLIPVLAALALMVAGCATSSHVLTGVARPAIPPDQVKVYSAPPQTRYEQIAVIDANSSRAMAITSQQKTDAVVARLKEEAAKLGANGIILQGIGDQSSGGGVSLGGFSMGRNVGIGTGVTVPVTRKAGTALAIYVSP